MLYHNSFSRHDDRQTKRSPQMKKVFQHAFTQYNLKSQKSREISRKSRDIVNRDENTFSTAGGIISSAVPTSSVPSSTSLAKLSTVCVPRLDNAGDMSDRMMRMA